MHQFDKYGELHRKQMRDVRHAMILDLVVTGLCLASAVVAFLCIHLYCKGDK